MHNIFISLDNLNFILILFPFNFSQFSALETFYYKFLYKIYKLIIFKKLYISNMIKKNYSNRKKFLYLQKLLKMTNIDEFLFDSFP